LLTLIICFILITTKTVNKIPFSFTPFLFLLYTGYVNINAFFSLRGISIYNIYTSTNALFLICLMILFVLDSKNIYRLFQFLILASIIESLLCIMQYTHWAASNNSLFLVTGTWVNPNVTALFQAMTLVVSLGFAIGKKGFRIVATIAFLLGIVSLIMLQCRTAYLGGISATLTLLVLKFDLINKMFKKSVATRAVIIIGSMLLIIPFMYSLYIKKQASADGRIFIWKVSYNMIKQQPLFGYGYGTFERKYNLFQADYIKQGKASPNEIVHAGFVSMSYNEYLQNMLEGGILGFSIFILLLINILITPIRAKAIFNNQLNEYSRNKIRILDVDKTVSQSVDNGAFMIAYSGSVAFAVMSLTNFTLQAIPAMLVFVIFVSLLSCHSYYSVDQFFSLNKFSITNRSKRIFSIFSALITLCYICYIKKVISANLINKDAFNLANEGFVDKSELMLRDLSNTLLVYESYWINYGNIMMSQQKYLAAIDKFQNAKKLTSSPDLYLKTGLCLEHLGKYSLAKKQYLQAMYIQPNRILYKYKLMKLYEILKEQNKALEIANEIIIHQPKLNSDAVLTYKQEAKILVLKYKKTFRSPIVLPRSLILQQPKQ
jgi:O-antigen polymerase